MKRKMQPCGVDVVTAVRLCAEKWSGNGGPVFVALTEASKLESAMVCVAERMLFRHPKRQPGLRPSTGLCV